MKSGNKPIIEKKKKQTNLNIVAICTGILQIKMIVNMAAELYIIFSINFRSELQKTLE